jgi:LmbE family N-acetylglucosaminyl deacetylase
MKILIFSPHPDDDVIGCGGSIAKHIKQGAEVSVVYMTSGDSGSLKYTKEELARTREEEARRASEILGIKNIFFLRNADGYLEYSRENLIALISLIRREKPQIVYMPHALDAHEDHRQTSKLAAESVARAAGPWFQECEGDPWSVDTALCYEVWTPLQEVSYVEDITEVIETKIQALQQHKSQVADISYDEAVKGLNRYRGAMTGKGTYCECFQVLKASSLV